MSDPELIEIPYQQLSSEALRGVMEEFATRGGFESDLSLESRLAEIEQKLKQGKVRIVFNPADGSTNLVNR